MLKNKSATNEAIVGDDRPRKKLSFRDPEVVPISRNGLHSAPSVLMKGSPSLQKHFIMRPHSVSGMSATGHYPDAKGVTVRSSGIPSSPMFGGSVKSLMVRGSHSVPNSPASTPKSPNIKLQVHPTLDRRKPKTLPEVTKTSVTSEDKSKNDKPKQVSIKSQRSTESGKPNKVTALPADRFNERSSVSLEDLALENQAMRIVRTVGQAFEVCHKMAVKEKSPSVERHIDEISQGCSDASSDKPRKDEVESESGQEDLLTLGSNNEEFEDDTPCIPSNIEHLGPPPGSNINRKAMSETFSSPLTDPLPMGENLTEPGTPLSMHHEVQLMREQLEQQQQQTQAAVAQVHLLRDQLAAETAARLEAQARAHQLLVHNKELIEHIQQLVIQIRKFEIKKQNISPINQHKVPNSKDIPNQLSQQSDVEASSLSWLAHLQRLNQQASVHTQLSTSSIPDTPPTPSTAQSFLFPAAGPSIHLLSPPVSKSRDPSPRDGSSPIIFPLPISGDSEYASDVILPIPRQDASNLGHPNDLQYIYEDKSSTTSLSGESDLKHSSNQSSGEMLLPPSVAQLYSVDPWRLPQVPEDSVPLPPYGPAPLGNGRGQNLSAITRAASERYSRQETLAHLQRMAWARHTTK